MGNEVDKVESQSAQSIVVNITLCSIISKISIISLRWIWGKHVMWYWTLCLSESLNRYLKSDFGCVQRKCDNVSYTGCCPSTRHLHPEWRGGVRGFKSNHVYRYWSQGMHKHAETHRSNQPGFICRIIHLLTDSTGNDNVFYEPTINV